MTQQYDGLDVETVRLYLRSLSDEQLAGWQSLIDKERGERAE